MVDTSEFERWREAADIARRAAQVQVDAALYNWACFLAEQSAQLAMKGLLHGMGAGAWGHDLVQLGEALATSIGDAIPADTAAALRRLSRHYIPARYPDAHPSGTPSFHYGVQDAQDALKDLTAVLHLVDHLWTKLSRLAGEDRDGA
ncbi:MAG: HEPN domain-containing protein [Gemmatimonadaceae bacterium]